MKKQINVFIVHYLKANQFKKSLNTQQYFRIKIKKIKQTTTKNKDFSLREVTEMEIENGCD